MNANSFVKKVTTKLKNSIPLKIKSFVADIHRPSIDHVTFIGITGSAGKTTTKDLTAFMLDAFAPCHKTYLSFNTVNAIPATIWHTKKMHRYCVAELAAYGPGTMDESVRLFKPDIAVVTCIGKEHYAAYKSMDALAAEKEKIVLGLSSRGVAVMNMDDLLVRTIGENCRKRVIWFGEDSEADLRLIEAHSRWPEPLRFLFEYRNRTFEVRTQLHGIHMAIPVLASLGVALAANLSLEKAISAVEQFSSIEGRMQSITSDDGVVFIRDDWKAPYWSINTPLEFLKQAKAPRKIVIVGMICDVSGDYGPKYKIIARSCKEFADLIVFIGPHALRALRGNSDVKKDSIKGFLNIQNAAMFLREKLRPGDLVLVKGTNEQDHLVRLVLDREKPIQCWRDICVSQFFCDQCPELYKPSKYLSVEPVNRQSCVAACVIVGLGNPGTRFYRTPHNVGYRVLDYLAKAEGGKWVKHHEGYSCSIDLQGKTVLLFKPGTAMNVSGSMVQNFLARTGGNLQNTIIVHEDIKLAFGNVRLRSSGGDAGHKGMRSILSAFDTEDITRLRLGVGGLENTREAKWYDFGVRKDVRKARQIVLTRFSKEEENRLIPVIKEAAEIVKKCIGEKVNT